MNVGPAQGGTGPRRYRICPRGSDRHRRRHRAHAPRSSSTGPGPPPSNAPSGARRADGPGLDRRAVSWPVSRPRATPGPAAPPRWACTWRREVAPTTVAPAPPADPVAPVSTSPPSPLPAAPSPAAACQAVPSSPPAPASGVARVPAVPGGPRVPRHGVCIAPRTRRRTGCSPRPAPAGRSRPSSGRPCLAGVTSRHPGERGGRPDRSPQRPAGRPRLPVRAPSPLGVPWPDEHPVRGLAGEGVGQAPARRGFPELPFLGGDQRPGRPTRTSSGALLNMWYADSVVTIGLDSNVPRPNGTVTASGFSLLAGMVRYDEVATGSIDHVLTMALPTIAGRRCGRRGAPTAAPPIRTAPAMGPGCGSGPALTCPGWARRPR